MLSTVEDGDHSGSHGAIKLDSYIFAFHDGRLSHAELAAYHDCRNEAEAPSYH
jgi:hypothetical protein